MREPAYYAYTAPEPDGLRELPLAPPQASGPTGRGLARGPPVRGRADGGRPAPALLEFLESAYEAAADAAGWDRAALMSSWCPIPADDRPPAADARRRDPRLAVAMIDGTIVNVALPAIERDLGGGLASQQWVANAYLLALGPLILIGGSLGDIYGERRVFAIGVGAFGAFSLACALAPRSAC